MQSAIFCVLASLQVLEKLAIYREKGRIEAIYTIRRIKGIADSAVLILKQATTFINLNVTLLVTTSYKSIVILIIHEVSVNDNIGDFRTTIVVGRLRRRGVIRRS